MLLLRKAPSLHDRRNRNIKAAVGRRPIVLAFLQKPLRILAQGDRLLSR